MDGGIRRANPQRNTAHGTAGALTIGMGGATTAAVPALMHWPAPTVVVTVIAVSVLAGLACTVLRIGAVVLIATAALIACDAASSGANHGGLHLPVPALDTVFTR